MITEVATECEFRLSFAVNKIKTVFAKNQIVAIPSRSIASNLANSQRLHVTGYRESNLEQSFGKSVPEFAMYLALLAIFAIITLSGCTDGHGNSNASQLVTPQPIHIFVAAAPDGGGNALYGVSSITQTTYQAKFGGSGTNTDFSQGGSSATGIAVNTSGIYAVDKLNSRVVFMSDLSGSNFATFGGLGSGAGQFSSPNSICADTLGRIYVADSGNHRIVRLDNIQGQNFSVSPQNLGLGGPFGVSVGADTRIYAADTQNRRILRIDDLTGKNLVVSQYAGFQAPTAATEAQDGHIYVVDALTNQLIVLNGIQDVNPHVLGGGGGAAQQFSNPQGVAVDGSGHIFVADTGNNRIVEMNDDSGTGWISQSAGWTSPFGVALR